MRKLITTGAIACVLAVALAGCSSDSDSKREKDLDNQTSALVSVTQDVLASSAAVQAEQADMGAVVDWTSTNTAEEAAKGAGFTEFGVMDKITVNGVDYNNPTFSYAGGVAQAMYENGAIAIFVRKADGPHTAPLTDRNQIEFAANWVEELEGLEVTLYGPSRGATVVADWNDDMEDFTVTYQGLGGEEVTMTTDEVAAIVKGFKDANVVEPKQDQSQDQQPAADQGGSNDQGGSESGGSDAGGTGSDDPDAGGAASGDTGSGGNTDDQGNVLPISADQAASMAVAAMGGTATNVQLVNSDLYGTCWFVTLAGDDTIPAGCYVNMYGGMFASRTTDNPEGDGRISMDQASILAAQTFGGYAQSVSLIETDTYGTVWDVHVNNDNGDTGEYYVTMDGAAYRVDK